ncbi:hypothetical protein KGY73_06210 [bacterium]|nr:hypothetical protein [bacterium]
MNHILFMDGSCHGISPVRPRFTHPPVGPFRCGRAGEHPVPPILFEKEQKYYPHIP